MQQSGLRENIQLYRNSRQPLAETFQFTRNCILKFLNAKEYICKSTLSCLIIYIILYIFTFLSSDIVFSCVCVMKEAYQDMQHRKRIVRLQYINHSRAAEAWHTPKLEIQ